MMKIFSTYGYCGVMCFYSVVSDKNKIGGKFFVFRANSIRPYGSGKTSYFSDFVKNNNHNGRPDFINPSLIFQNQAGVRT